MIRFRLVIVLIATLSFALACGGGDKSQASNPLEGSSPALPTVTSTTQSEGRPVSTPSGSPPQATSTPSPAPPTPRTGLPAVHLEQAFDGATFAQMTGLYEDASGNWYVTEKAGRVRRIDSTTGKTSVWLDLTDRVDSSGGEMGLLGFALAPDFEASRVFYVDYTGSGQTVLARFGVGADGTPDRSAEQRLLTVNQPFSNHNGGQIVFGPDGYLYMGLGDGGGANDPNNNGQNTATLLGSILRLDVSGEDGYQVPADNPLVGQSGARPEIWAYGLRNPWRFSFDRATGDLWVGDVGEHTREEIDLVVRGGNYGWSVMEGFGCRGGATDCDDTGLLPPVFDYAHGSGGTCSVTGGFVYRGQAVPALEGAYVFSDYCNGAIYALRAVDGVMTEQAQIGSTGFNVSSLAEGRNGELYVLQFGPAGAIFKIVS